MLLAPGTPVHADDPIGEWLKQDESDSENDQVRPDLHALTDQQLQDIFKIGRDQADGHQLIERGSEERPHCVAPELENRRRFPRHLSDADR